MPLKDSHYTHAKLHVTASNIVLSPSRAVSQLVAGRLQLHQGDDRGKLLLTRALKIAHHSVSNRQLVSQARPAHAGCQQTGVPTTPVSFAQCEADVLSVAGSVDAARHPEVSP